ncbi:hypothetical protein [Luteimicrobium sp. DT211]|uniref:hypothetical protein n=1 Tax=Luteimicrobium sp. DT211 TaxID=3393412 RepID=UPI003CF6A985
MTPPSGAPGAVVDRLGLLLPDDWWAVDLTDERARRRSVRGLVARQFGRSDKPSALQLDVLRELDATTRAAAAARGGIMAFSLMQAGDKPLSASLTTFRVPAPAPSRIPRKREGLARLAADLTAAAAPGVEVVVADGPLGSVVRQVAVERGPAELDADRTPQLVARYWLDPRDGEGWYQLVFSTHLVALRDGMLGLFDAIVASVGHDDDPDTHDDDPGHAAAAVA